MPPRYWLIKTEPESFAIQDLANSPDQTTFWNGVRNYQARNFLRDELQVGDRALFHHSSADPPVVVGTVTVVSAGYPDFTARDTKSQYYDPKATDDNPIWFMVDVRLERIFEHPLSIERLRGVAGLKQMELLRQGSRLSVQPVRPAEFEAVLKLSEQVGADAARDVGPTNTRKKKAANKSRPKTSRQKSTRAKRR